MKKRTITLLFLAGIALLFFSFSLILRYTILKQSNQRCTLIGTITPFGFAVPYFHCKLSQAPFCSLTAKGHCGIPWKSVIFGISQLLAFEGPGTITLQKQEIPLDFSGSIEGNIRTGNITIHPTTLLLETLGKIMISGRLKEWGKGSSLLSGSVENLSLEKLQPLLSIQGISLSGTVRGPLTLSFQPGQKTRLTFDLEVSEFSLVKNGIPFSGHIKGSFQPDSRSVHLEKSTLTSPTAGTLSLSGTTTPQGFDLAIVSTGLNILEVLSNIPEQWRNKTIFNAATGTFSIAGKTQWKQGSLPLFQGTASFLGKLAFPSFSCTGFSITGKPGPGDNAFDLIAKNVTVGRFDISQVKGTFTREGENLSGSFSFPFANGKGSGLLKATPVTSPERVSGVLNINGFDMKQTVEQLNPDIVFTGIMDLAVHFKKTGTDLSWRADFENRPGKRASQHLNISAIRALANFSTGSAVGMVGKQNFYYNKFAGSLLYHNGFLTLEGSAKKTKNYSYLLVAEKFSSGVNILVDPKNNTIRLSDLKQRLSRFLNTT